MQIANVTFRRLRYFLAVAEELHFGRAASRLGVAQPALSRQIAELETAIGARLFDRVRNRIFLTQAGEALLPQARDILLKVSEAARLARAAGEGATGSLGVGFVGSATFSALPAFLQGFRERYEGVALNLSAMNNADLRRALVNRTIDVAFARSQLADDEFESRRVLTEPLVAAIPQSQNQRFEGELGIADLKDYRFIVYPRHPRPSFADEVIALCSAAGFSPQIADETMDLQTALALVSVGGGVSIVPASVKNSHLHGVSYLPLSDKAATTSLFMVWRRDNRSEVLRNLLRQPFG